MHPRGPLMLVFREGAGVEFSLGAQVELEQTGLKNVFELAGCSTRIVALELSVELRSLTLPVSIFSQPKVDLTSTVSASPTA